ncbi:MAG: repeat-containing protein [Burkholderiaceae bacterium]|nr:repeat-containing protein [Burkholderiaceae bacterium]
MKTFQPVKATNFRCRRWQVPEICLPVFLSMLLLFTACIPAIGWCNDEYNQLGNLFGSEGRNMEDVATKIISLPGERRNWVKGLDFSPDGKYLATVTHKDGVKVWDWQNARVVRTLGRLQGSNIGLVRELLKFSPDGHMLATCHDLATNRVVIRIWRTDTWEVLHEITDPMPGSGCNAINFTPDGKHLVRIAHHNPKYSTDILHVYDTTTWETIWTLQLSPFRPYALAISPDGKWAAIGGYAYGGGIKHQSIIVDMEKRMATRTIPNTVDFAFGHLAWSPDGARLTAIGRRGWDGLAYTGGPENIMTFDAHSGRLLAAYIWGRVSLLYVRYTPDGKYLIESDMNDRGTALGARIWDGTHNKQLQHIPGAISSLAVSRDSRYLATGSDRDTTIWKLKQQ